MSLSFKPTNEKEIAESQNITPGTYPFEVMEALATKSKKGNDMIQAELRLFMPDGKERGITAYLMAAMPAQLFHFCTYCGLATEYGNGTLTADDCIGKTGYVEITTQKGKPKDDGSGNWPDRSSIKDFVRPAALKPGAMAQPAAPKAPSEHMEGDPY